MVPDRAEEVVQVRGQRAKHSRPFSSEALAAKRLRRLSSLANLESIPPQSSHSHSYSSDHQYSRGRSPSTTSSSSKEEESSGNKSSASPNRSGSQSRHSDDQALHLDSEGGRAEQLCSVPFGRVTGGLRYSPSRGPESPFNWFHVSERDFLGEPKPACLERDGRGIGWVGPFQEESGGDSRPVGVKTTQWNRVGLVVVDFPPEAESDGEEGSLVDL